VSRGDGWGWMEDERIASFTEGGGRELTEKTGMLIKMRRESKE